MGQSVISSSPITDSNNNYFIDCIVTCSDAMVAEKKVIFHQHTVPSSLFRQLNPSSNQHKMQLSALMQNLIKTHHNEVFQVRSWSCVECNRPATTLIHHATSYLHSEKPQIIDFTATCCENKICDNQIQLHFAQLMAIFDILNVD